MKLQPFNDSIAPIYDAMYSKWTSTSQTKAECQAISKLIPKNGRIIDLGCGTGRHLIGLSRLGFQVTGVEPSLGMIEQVHKKYPKAFIIDSSVLEILSQDLKPFDAVICMWNALCEIALDEDSLDQFFDLAHQLTNDSGKLFLDISVLNSNEAPKRQFNYVTFHDGMRYEILWKLLDFSGLISTSEQTIQVFNQSNTLIKTDEVVLKQKWWSKEQLISSANKNGWKLEPLTTAKLDSDRYFIGSSF